MIEDELKQLANLWESMSARPNGIYEQCARDLREVLSRQNRKTHDGVVMGITHPGPSQMGCIYCIQTLEQGLR